MTFGVTMIKNIDGRSCCKELWHLEAWIQRIQWMSMSSMTQKLLSPFLITSAALAAISRPGGFEPIHHVCNPFISTNTLWSHLFGIHINGTMLFAAIIPTTIADIWRKHMAKNNKGIGKTLQPTTYHKESH